MSSLYTLTQAEKDTLEGLVDTSNLATVLEALTEICHGKAEHLQSTWQDAQAAKSWERDARVCEAAQGKVHN